MLRIVAATLIGCVGALSPPASSVSRRQVAGSLGALAAALVAAPVCAYDAIPTIEPDFAAMELQRQKRLEVSEKKTAELRKKIKALTSAPDGATFVAASDDMALWVIGEGSIPEGIKVKTMVAELKDAYEALPKKSYACEMTRTSACRPHLRTQPAPCAPRSRHCGHCGLLLAFSRAGARSSPVAWQIRACATRPARTWSSPSSRCSSSCAPIRRSSWVTTGGSSSTLSEHASHSETSGAA